MEKILIIIILGLTLFLIFSNNSVVYVVLGFDVETDLPPFLNSTLGLDAFPEVLNFLSEEGVRATFFMTGKAFDREGLVSQIIEGGHELASHSFYHENLTAMSSSELAEDFKFFSSYNFSSFRAPFNQYDDELVDMLQVFGYSVLAGIVDYPVFLREDLLLLGSKPLFYPSSVHPRSWTSVFDETISLQSDKKIKVVVVGVHPWEFVNLSSEGFEEYTLPSGNYTWNNFRELVWHAKRAGARFVTMKEFYDLFNN